MFLKHQSRYNAFSDTCSSFQTAFSIYLKSLMKQSSTTLKSVFWNALILDHEYSLILIWFEIKVAVLRFTKFPEVTEY